MKKFQLSILLGVLLNSCCSLNDNNMNSSTKTEYQKPTKPCEDVSWKSLSVITHGYSGPSYEKVIIETYIKNSTFDSIIERYELKNDNSIDDTLRQQKSFILPEEIHSDVDLKIIIGKDQYQITHVKTGWTPRYGNEFVGCMCEIQNFHINGTKAGGNIILKNPKYNYPWEE